MTGLAYSHTGSLLLKLHTKWRLPNFQIASHILPLHISDQSFTFFSLIKNSSDIWKKKNYQRFPDRSKLLLLMCLVLVCSVTVSYMNLQKLVISEKMSFMGLAFLERLTRESHRYKPWFSQCGFFQNRDVKCGWFSSQFLINMSAAGFFSNYFERQESYFIFHIYFLSLLFIPRRTCNFKV